MNRAIRLSIAAVVMLCFAVNTQALVFWDNNGTTAGSGGPTPSGTWDVNSAHWSSNDNGVDPGAYGTGASSVAFSAGTDATGSYTITVNDVPGQVLVSDMHCDDGAPTIIGNPLKWGGAGQLISAAPGHTFTVNCLLTNDSSFTDAFHKYKVGTLVLGGSNNFHGSVTIEGGTIQLAGNQRIPSTSALILYNGDTRTNNDGSPLDYYVDTPATFNTGGFNQSFGPLNVCGPNSAIPRTIDFSNGHGTLAFANSSSTPWVATNVVNNSANPGPIPLYITNFSLANARLRFGTSTNGLTSDQLSQIQFQDYLNLPGVIDSNGFVTPNIPKFTKVDIFGLSAFVTWTSVNGRSYRLFSGNTPTSINNIVGDYPATDTTVTAIDSFSPPLYYRVQVLP